MSNTHTKTVEGMLARFGNTAELLAAAKETRDAGYKDFDCHSPFPIHGLDAAMGLKRSKLGWLVGLAGLVGTSSALALQWWSSSIEYPLVISGKPFFSYQAYLPITFAVGVLMAAATALIGMLALNGLPRLNHPVFNSEQFARATDDAFFISIEKKDPMFDTDKTRSFLESIGATDIEVLEE